MGLRSWRWICLISHAPWVVVLSRTLLDGKTEISLLPTTLCFLFPFLDCFQHRCSPLEGPEPIKDAGTYYFSNRLT